jgi:hypothetical protein
MNGVLSKPPPGRPMGPAPHASDGSGGDGPLLECGRGARIPGAAAAVATTEAAQTLQELIDRWAA